MDWLRQILGRGTSADGGATQPAVPSADGPWRDNRWRAPGPAARPPVEPPAAALPFRRTAYLPLVEDGPIGQGSGFGGVPFLADGVEHPACPRCRQPMPLIAQLDLAALPAPVVAGDGLLQLFYCTRGEIGDDCDTDLYGWAPFSSGQVVRIVPAGPAGAPSEAATPFEPLRVTGWEPVEDYPNWEELELLGADAGEPSDDVDLYPLAGEKLGGWPNWVQGVEYPACPTCGTTMRMVLQVDSRNNLAHDWGDMGTGHITQCPNHPDVLAFAWACS